MVMKESTVIVTSRIHLAVELFGVVDHVMCVLHVRTAIYMVEI